MDLDRIVLPFLPLIELLYQRMLGFIHIPEEGQDLAIKLLLSSAVHKAHILIEDPILLRRFPCRLSLQVLVLRHSDLLRRNIGF